jgi:hypothetical protein
MSPFIDMQPEKSTSAHKADALPLTIKQRTSEHIRVALSALELYIYEQILTSNAAFLPQLWSLTCLVVPTNQLQPIPPDATTTIEGGKTAQEPHVDLLIDGPELLQRESVDLAAYGKVIPVGLERLPRDIDEPRLWTLTDDTARFLNDTKSQARCDEYLHIGCNAFFDSCANTVIGEGLNALLSGPSLSPEHAEAVAFIRGVITPTQQRRRPPVLDWASSASPRADKRVRIRTRCSKSSNTSVSADHVPPLSPAH